MRGKFLAILSCVILLGSVVGCGQTEQPPAHTAHVDANNDGYCDECNEPMTPPAHTEHVDANNDGKCDVCGEDMGGEPAPPPHTEHVDENNDGKCDVCGEDMGEEPAPPYDFGDPSTWAGEAGTATDLGDCIVDTFPYDEKYDWGQCILWDEDDELYKMWWCRESPHDCIWYAESKDLKHWNSAKKVLYVEEDSTWVKMHVGKPSVLKLDGKYIMFFESPATMGNGLKEFNNNVLRADSDDGIHWELYKGETDEPYPVIRMTDKQMQDSIEASQQPGGSGYGFYGIGQPSSCYVNGTYYVYCTYTMIEGDRMYVFRSKDGIHFDEGQQVFTRAGCGIKYNTLTGKFMLAYESTQGRASRVYYMESDDGVKFTYDSVATAGANKEILSHGTGFVRGYPDFVGDGSGQVHSHTVYVGYMEGRMADSGNDWRQYSPTWDVHIAMYNPKEFALRTQVLPNGEVYSKDAAKPYKDAHEPYEELAVGISRTAQAPALDGEKDALYASCTPLAIARTVYNRGFVPGPARGTAWAVYTEEALYVYAEVNDLVATEGDCIRFLVGENGKATSQEETFIVDVYRSGKTEISGGTGSALNAEFKVKRTETGYSVEMKMPWAIRTSFEAYDTIAFESWIYDNWEQNYQQSVVGWNDFRMEYTAQSAGELYFL